MAEPWKTDKWFVSHWNYEPEVRAGLNFAKKIKLHDVSLRDGEQQAGLVFNREEKVKIAKKLDEVGIHRIEAGMPAVSKQDEMAIKDIASLGLKAEIFAFSRCMVEDVKKAADCGVKGIVMEIPSSEHIIKYAYRWSLQKSIDLSVEATLCAKENGLYTVFFPIDSSRADLNWFLDLIEKVSTEGHMDALVVVDTFGGCSPHAIPHFIKKIKERIAKPLEIHFHDDFGMGAANTIIGLACGGSVAHTTITSIGERAGNAAYEDVALALLIMYGIDLGLKTEKFTQLSRLIREITGFKVPSNRPIVGDMIFDIESGIIVSWLRNCGDEHMLELCPFRPELVGHGPPKAVLGKNSGLDSVKIYLEQLGIDATQGEIEEILLKVKDKSYKNRGLLTLDDFKSIVKNSIKKKVTS